MTPDLDRQIAELYAECYADPLGWVMSAYPWSTEPSIQQVKMPEPWCSRYDSEFGPDAWACDFLDELGAEIRGRKFNGMTPVDPIQFATVSGHGIGKSMLVAVLTGFVMNTRPYCHGTVTANSDPQLRTKTWAEIGRWHKLSLSAHWFDFNSSRGNMSLRHKLHPQSWFCTGQTSREENSESFAGQHAANSTSFYIFDEASGIADKIYEVRLGGLTDGEPMVFDFGNPTRNSGAFYEECEGKLKHRFRVRNIDSRSVQITNKAYFQRIIDDYGEDSDTARVRVKGQFPKSGSVQFISGDDVRQAMERPITQPSTIGQPRPAYYDASYHYGPPLVIGVDVARFGDDDSVLYPRLGPDARSFPPERYNGLDNIQVAEKVIAMVTRFRALAVETAAIFVDGGGTGSGVIDFLRRLGYPVFEVHFGGKPVDANAYRYKVDEMWGKMRDAIKRDLALPQVQGQVGAGIAELLRDELVNREYDHTVKGQINLESKSDMKDRGISSPNIADALALTFAQDVAMPLPSSLMPQGAAPNFDYDPLEANF